MSFADPRQKIAIAGVVAAAFFSFTFILIAALYFPFTMPEITGVSGKLVFAWQNLMFAALPLAAGACAVILHTMLRPSTLDGEPVQDGSRLDIHFRFVHDTSQQLLLFAIMLFNVAVFLEGGLLRLVPVLSSWFIIARLHYWIAYLISPPHRIFGSAATLLPTVFFLLLCAARVMGWL